MNPLTGKPLSYFKPFFTTLPPPAIPSLKGVYRGRFTGPAWLRTSAPSSLALAGLSGWWGKIFPGDGTGHNLVLRQGKLQLRFPIRLAALPSLVDSQPGLTVQYTAESSTYAAYSSVTRFAAGEESKYTLSWIGALSFFWGAPFSWMP